MTTEDGPREIALSAAWHAGTIAAELTTVDGTPVQIIHRGAWSHGFGPDFRDALLLFNGRELRAGGIEMHLYCRGWVDHGHHRDAAYDNVILHVVAHHDGTETRRSDGGLVPIVEIGSLGQLPLPDFATWEWDRVGGQVCAPRLATDRMATVRQLLAEMGDTRLAARSASFEARLPSEPPGEVLWETLLDGLGFSANREPMRMVARAVPIAAFESLLLAVPSVERLAVARGVLLGVAGFLPLSPSESHLGALSSQAVSQIEDAWRQRGTPWWDSALSPRSWQRARTRPANHPVSRLLCAADLVVSSSTRGGLFSAVVDLVRSQGEPVEPFCALATLGEVTRLGADRALDILASGVIPLVLSLAAQRGEPGLAEAAAAHWERLPAPAANAVTRRAARQVAGPAPLGKIGARGSQGLIHLDTVLCQPRRCFECPIAAAELSVKGS